MGPFLLLTALDLGLVFNRTNFICCEFLKRLFDIFNIIIQSNYVLFEFVSGTVCVVSG